MVHADETTQSERPVILIVDDQPDFLRGLSRSVPKAFDCSVLTAVNASEALNLIEQSPVDLLLTDVRMPDMDGLTLLEEVKNISPWTTVVIMTGYATIDLAVDAIKKALTTSCKSRSNRIRSTGFSTRHFSTTASSKRTIGSRPA